LNQNDLDWFAARLSIAVYDVNRISPEMSVLELKAALRDIVGSDQLTISYAPNGNQLIEIDGRTIEVGPMASNDEIRVALQNPFIRTENTKHEHYRASVWRLPGETSRDAAEDRQRSGTGPIQD
jgi:hypothetical protein